MKRGGSSVAMGGDDGSERRDRVGRGQRRWSTPEGASPTKGASTLADGGAANGVESM